MVAGISFLRTLPAALLPPVRALFSRANPPAPLEKQQHAPNQFVKLPLQVTLRNGCEVHTGCLPGFGGFVTLARRKPRPCADGREEYGITDQRSRADSGCAGEGIQRDLQDDV